MADASDQTAERAALEPRYWIWFWQTLDEDRLDCAPVPAEFRPLMEPPRA